MKIHKEPKVTLPTSEMCKEVFVSTSNLECHEGKYDGPRTCKICNTELSSKFNLQCHFETCCMQLNCKVCDYRCLTKEALSDHMVRCHESQKQYSCSTCNDVFLFTKGIAYTYK